MGDPMDIDGGWVRPPNSKVDIAQANTRLFETLLESMRKSKLFRSAESSFIVYAHDSENKQEWAMAHATWVEVVINWLHAIGTRTLSDKHPILARGGDRSNGTRSTQNIFANQACLVPGFRQPDRPSDIGDVDTVVVWCSPLLEKYCRADFAQGYMARVETRYRTEMQKPKRTLRDLERVIEREVHSYVADSDFHHVLTEIALIHLRIETAPQRHGIVPVALGLKMKDSTCLGLPPTDLWVCIEDVQADMHKQFFKILRRMHPSLDPYIANIQALYKQSAVSSPVTPDELGRLLDRTGRDASNHALNHSHAIRKIQVPVDMQHRQPYTERKNNLLSKLGQGNISCIEAKNRNATIVDGTCQWVKTHPSFTHWQRSGTTRLLLVTADPGCGKSVLARHLVDDVLSAHTFVCYFFFKDDYENQKTLVGALRSILHQILVAYDGLITDKMLQGNEDGSLDLDSVACLWKMITELPSSTTSPNIVCVIDALDECVEKDREELFRLLEAIRSDTMTPSRLKFLVTSRPYDNVTRPFRILRANQGAIHIRGDDDAQSEQISREVGRFIGYHVARLKIKFDLDMQEADLVYRTLASYKNRTYLWVELTLKSIEQLTRITKRALLQHIKTLPATVDAAYDGILARIEKDHKKIASRIFHFLIGACRPLTVDEMAFAIGLDESNYAHGQVDAVAGARAESFIRAVSGLFVHIKDNKVFLMHQTAREFLLCHTQTLGKGWKSSISIQNAHRELAAVCLIRLSMKDYFLDNKEVDVEVGEGPKSIYQKVRVLQARKDRVFEQTRLLEYAANNVVHHCCEAKDELSGWALDLASKLCRNKRLPNMTWFPHCRNWVGNLAPDTDLIVATSLRSVPLVKIMLQNIGKDVLDAKESFYGKTALRIAVDAGSSEIIQLLLDAGADPDIPDDKNEAPIHLATTQAMEENLEALLEAGAETDVLDRDGLSPLMLSCYDTAYEEATRILLAYRANTNFCNSKGRNALFYAAERCEVQQAMLLLRHGCDVTHADKEGNTALHLAAASVLDPEGCDVDPTIDDDGPELLALLIHYGADVNARNHKGETALHIAVGWKYGPVHRMKALISRKARMDVVDAKRRTPRHRALERGAQDAVKLLDACRKNSRLPASWGNTWPRAAWETA